MTHDDLTFECGKAAGLQDMAARKDAAYEERRCEASGGRACNVWILDAAADLLATPQAPTQGEDARDAARYRWLRSSVSNPVYCAFSHQFGPAMIHGAEVDRRIDEARAAQAQGNKT